GDRDLTRLPTHGIVALGIAAIPEGRKVFPRCTVLENLLLGAYLERDAAVIRQRLQRVFAVFPRLAERREQLAGTMSGGEQAMVSIGRGLMGAPKLLLIDEPSLGLSPLLVKENFAVIRRINEQGVTVFLVEQNVQQTLAIAHRGSVLSKGRVVARGSARGLLAHAQLRGSPRHRAARSRRLGPRPVRRRARGGQIVRARGQRHEERRGRDRGRGVAALSRAPPRPWDDRGAGRRRGDRLRGRRAPRPHSRRVGPRGCAGGGGA